MIYDTNAQLFKSFLGSTGGGHGSGPSRGPAQGRRPGESAKDNKTPLTE